MKLNRMDSWGHLNRPNCKQTFSLAVFVPESFDDPAMIDLKPDHNRYDSRLLWKIASAIQGKRN